MPCAARPGPPRREQIAAMRARPQRRWHSTPQRAGVLQIPQRPSAAAGQAASLPFAHRNKKEVVMGKYVLAWLFGVPAFVLVILYLIFN
jgi:hypothetical protein